MFLPGLSVIMLYYQNHNYFGINFLSTDILVGTTKNRFLNGFGLDQSTKQITFGAVPYRYRYYHKNTGVFVGYR